METIVLKISGMSCMGCVRNLNGVLSALPGVESVAVDLQAANATIRFNPAQTGPAQFEAAISDAGFDVVANG